MFITLIMNISKIPDRKNVSRIVSDLKFFQKRGILGEKTPEKCAIFILLKNNT